MNLSSLFSAVFMLGCGGTTDAPDPAPAPNDDDGSPTDAGVNDSGVVDEGEQPACCDNADCIIERGNGWLCDDHSLRCFQPGTACDVNDPTLAPCAMCAGDDSSCRPTEVCTMGDRGYGCRYDENASTYHGDGTYCD